jgi:D-psicose/D-tagatose/L-ribulose 3-epimerase
MKYAISNWIYGDEALETTCARLQRFGYDGIELKGEPQTYDPAEVTRLCKVYGLQVLSLAGIYPWPTEERDLANPDPRVRQKAVAYLMSCVDFAAEVGTPVVIVVPSSVAKTAPVGTFASEEEWMTAVANEWGHAVDSVREAALHAQARGVRLAVEPINRYETFLVNTCEQAIQFIQEVGSAAVGLHLDTFHMNIEEADLGSAFRRAGKRLLNVHIADSNRQGVGRGHTDFRAMMRALVDIGYQGSLALEPLPPVPDPYFAVRIKRFASLRDAYAEESITRLKALEAEEGGR